MFTLSAKWQQNGKSYESDRFDNDGFTLELQESDEQIFATLTAKADLDFQALTITSPHAFAEDDLFYANGYQAWTTSREYGKTDCAHGITSLAHISRFTTELAATSGDYFFADYGKGGVFHGYTYCYLRKKGSRQITLYGSKSERQGFTVFVADMPNGQFSIKKDIEGLHLQKGQVY